LIRGILLFELGKIPLSLPFVKGRSHRTGNIHLLFQQSHFGQ
jgi:hypothetical protein